MSDNPAQSADLVRLLQEVINAPILYQGIDHGQRYHAKALNEPLIERIRVALTDGPVKGKSNIGESAP